MFSFSRATLLSVNHFTLSSNGNTVVRGSDPEVGIILRWKHYIQLFVWTFSEDKRACALQTTCRMHPGKEEVGGKFWWRIVCSRNLILRPCPNSKIQFGRLFILRCCYDNFLSTSRSSPGSWKLKDNSVPPSSKVTTSTAAFI